MIYLVSYSITNQKFLRSKPTRNVQELILGKFMSTKTSCLRRIEPDGNTIRFNQEDISNCYSNQTAKKPLLELRSKSTIFTNKLSISRIFKDKEAILQPLSTLMPTKSITQPLKEMYATWLQESDSLRLPKGKSQVLALP